MTAGQIEAHVGEEQRGRKGPWWDRSDTKWVTEALWSSGVLTTATRVGFARHYDLTERVLPAGGGRQGGRRRRGGARADAARRRCARRRNGGRHPRLLPAVRRSSPSRRSPSCVADGELEPVEVDGWTAPAYLRAGQIVPRRDRGTALLCPFDPLIFFRPRVERLSAIPLPHRDLHARAQAPVRLLRVAVSARRQTRRTCRSEGRSRSGRAARRRRIRRGGSAAVTHRARAGASVADDGVVAGPGRRHGR